MDEQHIKDLAYLCGVIDSLFSAHGNSYNTAETWNECKACLKRLSDALKDTDKPVVTIKELDADLAELQTQSDRLREESHSLLRNLGK